MVTPIGQTAAADTTLILFTRDTQQTSVDAGPQGPGPGNQLVFSGDVFDRAGGTQLGRLAGQCTTMSGNATTGETFCAATFVLGGGQIAIQALADTAALFGRAEAVPVTIVGGTGIYSNAGGDGTFQAPNQTDGNWVLNITTR